MNNQQYPGKPKPRVVVCMSCLGNGKRKRIQQHDTMGKNSSVTEETCPVCEGSGRLVSTLTFKPFKPESVENTKTTEKDS